MEQDRATVIYRPVSLTGDCNFARKTNWSGFRFSAMDLSVMLRISQNPRTFGTSALSEIIKKFI